MRDRLASDILDPRTYGRIAYLLLALPLGIAEFAFLVTAISLGAGLAVSLIGIPILIATVYAWRFIAQLERRLIGALTGREIADPYRPAPAGASRWRRLNARLGDPATWKDLAFLLLQLPLGAVAFIVTVTVLSVGVAAVFSPFTFWAIPDGIELGLLVVDTLPEALVLAVLGAVVLAIGIPALGALGRLYGAYSEVLLGSNTDPALAAEMTSLRDARSRIIEAGDAERRRIERDLHDGAQQRLVALALTLRMAEKRLAEGDPGAAELVHSAGEEAGLALKELRDLARGIHPAILTNRGLPAALTDLAARAAVPVEVVAAPTERLPDQVEAAAYFVVSECLANIAKHSQATYATVAVSPQDGQLDVVVADDGVGGAMLDAGSGLQGLRDRVGALDGAVAVESPPGQGTRISARIPLTGSDPVPDAPAGAGAAERRRRRGTPGTPHADVGAGAWARWESSPRWCSRSGHSRARPTPGLCGRCSPWGWSPASTSGSCAPPRRCGHPRWPTGTPRSRCAGAADSAPMPVPSRSSTCSSSASGWRPAPATSGPPGCSWARASRSR